MDPYPRGGPLGAARGVRGPGGGRSQHGAQELRGTDALRRRRSRCSQVGINNFHICLLNYHTSKLTLIKKSFLKTVKKP